MDMLPPADRRPGAGGIIARLAGLLVVSLIAGLVLGLMIVPFAGGVGVTARDAVQGFESLPDAIETPRENATNNRVIISSLTGRSRILKPVLR